MTEASTPDSREPRPVAEASALVRLPPLPKRALGPYARLVAAVTARATRGEAPRIFTTLARHRRLFRRWLPFSAVLLLRGDLPRAERELVILRTAWQCGCWYEWVQHVPLAVRAGVGEEAVARVARGPSAPGWTKRERLLLGAVDQLHDRRVIGDTTWAALAAELTERQLIELCFLVGHYEMLASTLNSLGVESEPTALAKLSGPAAQLADELLAGLTVARGPISGDRRSEARQRRR